mmetsp:Transcript_3299/g.11591  ORF Transcript_3299/g.11591 Transcript_3299/m.11591 type:complete len:293 (+) Transcript_3299:1238-2116(+)
MVGVREGPLDLQDLLEVLRLTGGLVNEGDELAHRVDRIYKAVVVRVVFARVLHQFPQQQGVLAQALHWHHQECDQVQATAVVVDQATLDHVPELGVLLEAAVVGGDGLLLPEAVVGVDLDEVLHPLAVEDAADHGVEGRLVAQALHLEEDGLVSVLHQLDVREHQRNLLHVHHLVLLDRLQEFLHDDVEVSNVVLLGVNDFVDDLAAQPCALVLFLLALFCWGLGGEFRPLPRRNGRASARHEGQRGLVRPVWRGRLLRLVRHRHGRGGGGYWSAADGPRRRGPCPRLPRSR